MTDLNWKSYLQIGFFVGLGWTAAKALIFAGLPFVLGTAQSLMRGGILL